VAPLALPVLVHQALRDFQARAVKVNLALRHQLVHQDSQVLASKDHEARQVSRSRAVRVHKDLREYQPEPFKDPQARQDPQAMANEVHQARQDPLAQQLQLCEPLQQWRFVLQARRPPPKLQHRHWHPSPRLCHGM
jgi:hypothetical protein